MFVVNWSYLQEQRIFLSFNSPKEIYVLDRYSQFVSAHQNALAPYILCRGNTVISPPIHALLETQATA